VCGVGSDGGGGRGSGGTTLVEKGAFAPVGKGHIHRMPNRCNASGAKLISSQITYSLSNLSLIF
jgi:hypothetical protein